MVEPVPHHSQCLILLVNNRRPELQCGLDFLWSIRSNEISIETKVLNKKDPSILKFSGERRIIIPSTFISEITLLSTTVTLPPSSQSGAHFMQWRWWYIHVKTADHLNITDVLITGRTWGKSMLYSNRYHTPMAELNSTSDVLIFTSCIGQSSFLSFLPLACPPYSVQGAGHSQNLTCSTWRTPKITEVQAAFSSPYFPLNTPWPWTCPLRQRGVCMCLCLTRRWILGLYAASGLLCGLITLDTEGHRPNPSLSGACSWVSFTLIDFK